MRPALPDGEACQAYAECAAHFCGSEQRYGIATARVCDAYLL